jgi:hypothetical protein
MEVEGLTQVKESGKQFSSYFPLSPCFLFFLLRLYVVVPV